MSGRRAKAERRVRAVTSTGIKVEANHKAHVRVPEPVGDGEHMWIVGAVFRIADPAAEHHDLDTENLITIEGPGCWHCERAYTPEVARQPCRPAPELRL